MGTLTLHRRQIHNGPLVLVNARHPLQGPEPEGLVPADDRFPQILLERRTAGLLSACIQAVGGRGRIVPVSGWRSQREQQAIWDDTMEKEGPAFTRQYVALPGCSEHQTGLAIDLGLNQGEIDFIRPAFPYEGLCQTFRQTMAQYGWVQRYPAGKEAITGIGHEPWHFRYVGQPHAALMAERDLTLEEYIAWIRAFPYESRRYRHGNVTLSFLPAAPQGPTVVDLPEEGRCTLSGNNVDGFLLTEWGADHA